MKFYVTVWIICIAAVIIAVVISENGIKRVIRAPANNIEILLKNDKVTENQNVSGRIPHDLSPVNYKIRLQPLINGNLTINGKIEIIFNVVNSTDTIILNMVDIVSINETCKVDTLNKTSVEVDPVIINQTYEAYYQQYIIHLKKPLTKEISYKLSLEFIGFLNDKLVGFYLSTYEDASGHVRRLAATQFSPTDARRAFPCFDEPLFKATFDIILVRQQNMTAWSNMPIITTKKLENGWAEDHFNKTLRMSTYLIGFLISDFNSTKSNFINETTFNVLTRKEAVNQTDYSLFFGPKCLQYFEKYFQIKFPLPKLDMAAIPDFKFNGMENWGLIMYREAAILFDKNVTTVASKGNIARVIAHEIAHQWFGNLVTPEWWSDLWLKEGFANYMGYLAADAVEPSWKMMEFIVYNTLHSAFQLDSLRSSHPINVDVDHPDRITEIFDKISYNKGASIIRMMQHFLTEDVYKRGMTSYLQDLKFKNAKQEDLWRFLNTGWTNDTDLSVKIVMDSWTLQQGYPVVHVTMNGSDAILRQEPFLLEGNLLQSINFNTSKYGMDPNCPAAVCNASWWIPISYTYERLSNFSQTQPTVWMKPTDIESNIKNVSEDSWIIINVQKTGFYRVNYSKEMWGKLAKQLHANYSHIHPLNRAQLIDDSFNLARAGKVSYSIVVDIISYMKQETELTPWKTFFKNFYYVYNQAKFSRQDETLKKYLHNLITDIYQSLGFEDEIGDSYSTQSLRSQIVKWACKVDHPPCIESVNRYFNQWLKGAKGSFQNIRNSIPVVLCEGIRNSNESQWNETFSIYSKSNIQTEKIDVLSALGCINNSRILERFVLMSLNESSEIRKQDSATVFSTVSSSQLGRNITWKIIKEKWHFIAKYFGQGSDSLRTILDSSIVTFDSEELLDDLLQFTVEHTKDLGSVKQTLDQSFESGILNSVWKKDLFPELLSLLKMKLM